MLTIKARILAVCVAALLAALSLGACGTYHDADTYHDAATYHDTATYHDAATYHDTYHD